MLLSVVVVVHDVGTKPGDGFGARLAMFAIDEYRHHVSPRLSGVVSCRFKPTCSVYGRAAIEKYGLMRGGGKAAYRIARCGPWTKAGTIDLP